MFNNSRFTENNSRVIGYVLEYDAVCSNLDVIPNANSSENLGTGANEDVVTYNWGFPSASSYSYLVKDGHISPYSRPSCDDYAVDAVSSDIGGCRKIFTHA